MTKHSSMMWSDDRGLRGLHLDVDVDVDADIGIPFDLHVCGLMTGDSKLCHKVADMDP